MSETWRRQPERSTPLALKTICLIALKLGRHPARLLLYPITLYFLLFAPAQRRASLNYLARVFDSKPNWLHAAKHIHSFASTVLDRVFLLTGRFDDLNIQFPEINLPVRFSQQGKGCLLLGSHIGSFEVLRSFATKKSPLPLKILMHEEHNPNIVKIFNALNPGLANMIIDLGHQDCMLQVREFLDRGYAVGMLGDRVMKSEKTTLCELLGDAVEFTTAPILMAASLKVPVVMFFGLYKGGNQYEIHFELLAEKIKLRRETRVEDLRFWMQKYVTKLEHYMKKAPYNWFNFYDYWDDESKS